MTNEVQLIAWKQAIQDTVLYSGTCIQANKFNEAFRVTIAPIGGVATVGDLEGYWMQLTNERGGQDYFPIGLTNTTGGNWVLRPNTSFDPYKLSSFDFSNFATYQIVTREFISPNIDGGLITIGSNYVVTGDVSYLQGTTVQITLTTGFSFVFPVLFATYDAVFNRTGLVFPNNLDAPAAGLSGTWQIVFETTPYNIELYIEESISQNWRFTDISNFGTTGSFSREFRIPATKTNTELFGIVSEVNFNDDMNYFHTKLQAEIRLNTFPIAVGHIRLMRTYTQNGKHVDLEISFYAETPDLQRSIAEKKLFEIVSLPLLSHPISYNVVTGLECVVASGNIIGPAGVTATVIQIQEQTILNSFIGKPVKFVKLGVPTTTRIITAVDENASFTSDRIFWNIGLSHDYTGGTWELIDNGILNVVRYALCDRGQNWDATGGANSRPIADENIPLYAGDMTPHVNAWWLFQNILKDAGFTLNPTPLESILSGYWCPWINSPSIQVSNQDNQYLFRAQLTNTTDFDFGDFMSFPEIYDNNNNFSGTAYSAPFPAFYTFRVWLTFTPVNLYDGQQSISFQLTNGSTIYFTQSVFISAEQAIAQVPINVQFVTPPIFIDPNVGSASVLLQTNTYYNNTPFYGAATYDVFNASGWELVSVTNPAYDAVVQLNANAPDVKQIDFVKDVLNMHCCAVVPDTAKPNVLNIVPLVDYVNSGDTLDWTNKLDISKDITLLPTTDKQKQNLLFTYKTGGDRASKAYADNGRTYGEYKIDGYTVNENNKINDFANGELKIQLTAESNPAYFIAGTSVVISKYINENKQFVVPNLRFLYMAETVFVKMFDDTNAAVADAAVFTTNHYSNAYATVNDYDLNWAPEVSLHVIESNPYNNLFNLYWRDYLNELYSPQARILEAFFALEIMDVQSFSFADKIWIKDSYWRILEIQDYKVGMNESTKVVLLKTDFVKPDCSSVPTGDSNGQIEFVDFNGDPVPATATCCIRYGYTWNAQLGWCIGRGQGTNQPDNPNDGGNAMTNVMLGQRVQPSMKIAMVTGANVSADNNWSAFVGSDITIGANNSGTLAVGRRLKLDADKRGAVVLGKNVLAKTAGFHLGGGWITDSQGNADGGQQYGIVIFSCKDNIAASMGTIPLFIEGITDNHIELENETSQVCTLTLNIQYDTFSGYAIFWFRISKDAAGVCTASAPVLYYQESDGTAAASLVIDTITNTSQHRLLFQAYGTGFPNNYIVTGSLQYIQLR